MPRMSDGVDRAPAARCRGGRLLTRVRGRDVEQPEPPEPRQSWLSDGVHESGLALRRVERHRERMESEWTRKSSRKSPAFVRLLSFFEHAGLMSTTAP